MLDPRTPILVGGGQLNQRQNPVEPVDMIVQAARRAADDAHAPGLAERADSVRIIGLLSWRYRDPGLLVSERLGARARHTVYTGSGGSHPQALVNDAAEDIAAGRCDVVVVGGAEAWRTRMALKRAGERPDWTVQGETIAPDETRPEVPMRHESEVRAGLDRPAYIYPLFEQSLRIRQQRSIKDHRAEIARLWARFSDVAAENPHAWSQKAVSAETIETPTPDNRVISWPYTKFMNSNNNVEQAAAVIVCSVEAAIKYGVPRDRWVFLRAGSEASDRAAIAERAALDASPAIRHASATALELADVSLDTIGPIDLYSCFPSAVQVAAREIGLSLDGSRPLTVTGGLTFAGGPWNNYSTHAIATMLDRVRSEQKPGLLTANSGYLTKHSIGIYSPDPGKGFKRQSAQAKVDREDSFTLASTYEGSATLESWTVLFDRDGAPEKAMASLLTSDGRRTLASTSDGDLINRLVVDEAEGSQARVSSDATFMVD